MLVPLHPGFQHYAWGDTSVIPELFDVAATGEPFAEAWLGAHPVLPARAHSGEALDALILRRPEELLGRSVRQRFGTLPYLLKILAAARPLSIQVHPSKTQAEAGFARENAAGILLDAPQRNYRDANHKPELIVALTPFDALCGFRSLDVVSEIIRGLPEIAELVPPPEATAAGLRDWVTSYFALPPARLMPALRSWVQRLRSEDARAAFPPTRAEHWVIAAVDELCPDGQPDAGLVFVLLLNLVRLRPGQGLFLPAGVLHAYLGGAGIEVMASSDNVLRGGLTPKHVDRAELCKIVDFSGGAPPVVTAEPVGPGAQEAVYVTPAPEFALSVIELNAGEPFAAEASGPETLLVLELAAGGAVRVRAGDESLALSRGGACLVGDRTAFELRASERAKLCRVRVPALTTSS